jgi:hypothetical protein
VRRGLGGDGLEQIRLSQCDGASEVQRQAALLVVSDATRTSAADPIRAARGVPDLATMMKLGGDDDQSWVTTAQSYNGVSTRGGVDVNRAGRRSSIHDGRRRLDPGG